MSEPTASTLAADVRHAIARTRATDGPSRIAAIQKAHESLDALVAQVDTLTRDVRTAMDAAERFREQGMKDAERAEAAEAALADATAIIRRFHEACWDYDGDLPDEVEAAAGDAMAFLGDTFRLAAGDTEGAA